MVTGVPPCPDPELSIVMVSHGAWDLTSKAISALVAHTEREFELIVVDNASDPDTRARLSELRNVRTLLNEQNVGFGPANNQGASEARGEYLLLLNTDVFVRPGWLEPLLDAAGAPATAAAVPRLLYADGSLQEAGGLLARDGSVMLYGDGDDPDLPCYRFRRRIDYGSAACMLIRTEAFTQAGGFDDRYAPAYFEDTDLCMRFARDGLSVLYAPGSTVTHLRHGSGEPASARQLSERNHGLFFDRWRDELAGRPWTLVNASEQAVIAARDALATPRVLICAEPGQAAAGQLVKTLLQGWPRTRITCAPGAIDDFGPDAGGWLSCGVELMPGRDATWLERRLFHYDVVITREGLEGDLERELMRTQPQAPRLALEAFGAGPDGALDSISSTLARLGIGP